MTKKNNIDVLFDELMQDNEFKKEYESLKPEFDIIQALIDARTSKNMTQKQLADKTGISQADISKIEKGIRNPSLKLLKKLAEGMDMTLQLRFIPKEK